MKRARMWLCFAMLLSAGAARGQQPASQQGSGDAKQTRGESAEKKSTPQETRRESGIVADNLARFSSTIIPASRFIISRICSAVAATRSIAEDAGEGGQILEESDLSENAITERLHQDLRHESWPRGCCESTDTCYRNSSRGSRRLEHYHGKQLLEEVDACDLLLHGIRGDMKRLENGDSLRVPPLEASVTVDGMVRRPALYELRGEKNLNEVLELAGGILPAAALRHIEVQRLTAHEKRSMLSLEIGEGSVLGALGLWRKRILIFGTAHMAELAMRGLTADPFLGYQVAGILDDNPNWKGKCFGSCNGASVYILGDLAEPASKWKERTPGTC